MGMKISVCIPTWEQHGYGVTYLNELLVTIKGQSFKNFNVVVSDHSINDEIESLVNHYREFFEIVYIKNHDKRGNSPANTNVAIKNADGDIIKIMFQDDLFVSKEALQLIHDNFNEKKCSWLVNGCNHTNDGVNFNRDMIPSWNDQILYGVNTISSPSVLSFINSNVNFFDENLTMLMDCEYYHQLYVKYGKPFIVNNVLISNRVHPNQISSRYDKSIIDEINYIKNKYKHVNL